MTFDTTGTQLPAETYVFTAQATDAAGNPGLFSNPFQVTVIPWTNPRHSCDVNDDGSITPLDVLVLITEINTSGLRKLPMPPLPGQFAPPYLDPSGDGELWPLDVLIVVQYLNLYGPGPVPEGGAAGQGEGESLGLGDFLVPAGSDTNSTAPAVHVSRSHAPGAPFPGWDRPFAVRDGENTGGMATRGGSARRVHATTGRGAAWTAVPDDTRDGQRPIHHGQERDFESYELEDVLSESGIMDLPRETGAGSAGTQPDIAPPGLDLGVVGIDLSPK